MPIYMVNVLPRKNFEDLYKIREIHYAYFTIEAIKSYQKVKQCNHCQDFGNASEVCKFTPKCVKCAHKHPSIDCPLKGCITHMVANCGLEHPASYRGFIKTPYRRENNNNQNNKPTQNSDKRATTETQLLAEIFKDFKYTKNK